MGENRSSCRVLVGKPEGNRPLAGHRRSWKNDIKEIEWEGVNHIDLVQDRDKWQAGLKAVKNLWGP
jgi:hypothetical protein